jgi:hypothetical protein
LREKSFEIPIRGVIDLAYDIENGLLGGSLREVI